MTVAQVAPAALVGSTPAAAAARRRFNPDNKSTARARWLGAATAGFALIGLAVVFLGEFSISNRSWLVQVLQIGLMLYTSVGVATCVSRTRPRIGGMIVYLWVYTLFGLVQTVQLSKSDNPYHVYASDALIADQLVVILIGLSAFDVVAFLARRGSGKPIEQRRSLSLVRVNVLAVLTILATPYLVIRLGGTAALFGSRLSVSQSLGSLGGSISGSASTTSVIILEFANVAPFLCIYALLRIRKSGGFFFSRRPLQSLVLVGLLIDVVLFDNPISQPRFWIAAMVIAVALAGGWTLRIGFQLALIVAYIVASIILFPFLDLTRYSSASQASVTPSSSVTDTYTRKTDYGTMMDVAATIDYVDDHGHTDGAQIAGAVLFFVPRSVWPDKANDTARLVATQLGFTQNLNLDSPLWAEGYIDYGVPGVVVLLGMFGFVIGRIDRFNWGGRYPRAAAATVMPLIAGYSLILLRGSLLQAMGRLAVILILGWVISKRGRSAG